MNHSINDSYVNRIAKHLIVNSSFMDNLGLFNGKMGIVIFFYHFAKYSQKAIYYDFANKLLDEIYSEIHSETPINLKNGFAGIGWSIEYLLQNNFLEGNSNEALADIDSKIMEYEPMRMNDRSLETGASGLLFYTLTRLYSPKHASNDNPFSDSYLKSWHDVALTECGQTTDISYFSKLFLHWEKKSEEVHFTINNFLPHILPEFSRIDDDFVFLPYGLQHGCAGIGLKMLLS